jgi:hypothetical protein
VVADTGEGKPSNNAKITRTVIAALTFVSAQNIATVIVLLIVCCLGGKVCVGQQVGWLVTGLGE